MSDFNDAVSTNVTPASVSAVAPTASQSLVVSSLGTTYITTVKLIGSANYLSWATSVKMWFKG